MNTETAAYEAITAFFKVLGLIPRPLARWMGIRLGHLCFLVDAKHRRIAEANLERAFGHERSSGEIRALARRTFQQLGQIIFEIGWLQHLDGRRYRKHFQVAGLAHLSAPRSRRTGALYMTAHVGNWEVLPVVAGRHGIDLNIVYRPLDFPPLNRFFEMSRSRFGAGLIPTARSMRKILKILQNGGGVVMLMDQNFDCHEGVFADFFGYPACTNKGLALLARKTGVPVIPALMHRTERGFRVEIGPEIPFVRTGDKTKDLEINTQRYNRVIEAFVRRHPDQWFWVHQRWKTRPYHSWPRPTCQLPSEPMR